MPELPTTEDLVWLAGGGILVSLSVFLVVLVFNGLRGSMESTAD